MAESSLTYEQYLDTLPPDRRDTIARVWQVVRDSMPEGYTEQIGPKFLTFTAGAEQYVALANQKNYVSLYLIPVYTFPEMKARLDASGRKLKIGKSCIHFTRADELPLDVIGEILAAHDAPEFAEHVRRVREESSRARRRGGG